MDTILLGVTLVFLGALYLFGSTYAATHIRKNHSFQKIFARTAGISALLALAVFTPIFIATQATASIFPSAWDAAYGSMSVMQAIENYGSMLLAIFSAVTIPFIGGVWFRYYRFSVKVQNV